MRVLQAAILGQLGAKLLRLASTQLLGRLSGEDCSDLAIPVSLLGLLAIKEAHDIETRLNEVEKLLETVISMPCKVSQTSQWGREARVACHHTGLQTVPEIMRSNGFCLANTETIVIDHSIPNGKDQLLDADSTELLFENGGEFTPELEDGDDPAAYVTNLSYYHLVPFETDILD
ncbi:hypothetical protein A6R68_17153 [Neotoma lepida]|uniref:Uncharacterized protein n=1 Tax=Neotoma lepida TaxID=56216 RepID=A0A1A6HEN9_NEOLE|nr:hypothetical protein A6R68_17153 [Neotoma lepida]